MAVIRDVNLDTTNDNIVFIGTIGVFCLIVAVLGIKLRWFKHRMTFNDLPTTSVPTNESNGMEPQIIRATFKPSSDFDNYVEVTPPKVLPPVRILKASRNAISLPPRKRQAPEVPTLRISHTNDPNEIEPLQPTSSEQIVDNLVVEERRKSTPPPPLPASPPPIDHEERILLSLEANYNYTESETIKIKEVQNNSPSILPSPPPYQESDPLAHIHFKKFTKKKVSSTQISNVVPVAAEESEKPKLRKKSVDLSPLPKDEKLDRRYSFLNQVPTPTELPKLAFDFPSTSTPNLSDHRSELVKSTQSTSSLADDKQKPNEKKGLLEYFGLKLGSKTEGDLIKTKNEKKEPLDAPKTENKKKEKKEEPVVAKNVNKTKNDKNVVPVASKNEKKEVPAAVKNDKKEMPVAPKIEKQKVKKIRVLKTEKNENASKMKAGKSENLAAEDVKSDDHPRHSSTNIKAEQSTLPDFERMENRMEIDYFQKVKKAKPNRVPIIVKSPKPETKEEKPKNEVFRHEETFSAANGPLKVKKKKNKTVPEDVAGALKPVVSKVPIQNDASQMNEVVQPIPKPRVILKLDGFDNDTREMEMNNSKKKVVTPVISSPSSPSDTEDTWNLVAKHRLNTRAITATAISARQKSESEETTNASSLQIKQIEMLNKPKTMREMKREQEERRAKFLNFGEKDDKESDTEA